MDFPDVIEIADRLYPEHAEHSTIGASVVDPDWLEQIPGDRPVMMMMVADGLFMFLPENDVRQVFRQVVDHFPRGEFVFNAYAPLVKERSDRRPGPVFEKYGLPLDWVMENARGVERFDDRLHYVEEESGGVAPNSVSPPKSSDAELLTLAVAHVLLGVRSGGPPAAVRAPASARRVPLPAGPVRLRQTPVDRSCRFREAGRGPSERSPRTCRATARRCLRRPSDRRRSVGRRGK
ncbi:hypothetical protein GCM10023075_09360 [Streptosporangium album]